MTAVPWLLLAATLTVLFAAAIGLLLDRRDLRNADAEIDRLTAELDAVDAENERLTADNTNLVQHWRTLARDLAQTRHQMAHTRGERDLARDTVRELLDAQAAGHRWPKPTPLPMPGDVDNALTAEFTKIIERNVWPEAPSS